MPFRIMNPVNFTLFSRADLWTKCSGSSTDRSRCTLHPRLIQCGLSSLLVWILPGNSYHIGMMTTCLFSPQVSIPVWHLADSIHFRCCTTSFSILSKSREVWTLSFAHLQLSCLLSISACGPTYKTHFILGMQTLPCVAKKKHHLIILTCPGNGIPAWWFFYTELWSCLKFNLKDIKYP